MICIRAYRSTNSTCLSKIGKLMWMCSSYADWRTKDRSKRVIRCHLQVITSLSRQSWVTLDLMWSKWYLFFLCTIHPWKIWIFLLFIVSGLWHLLFDCGYVITNRSLFGLQLGSLLLLLYFIQKLLNPVVIVVVGVRGSLFANLQICLGDLLQQLGILS